MAGQAEAGCSMGLVPKMNFPPANNRFTDRSEEACEFNITCAMNSNSHCRFFEMVNTITEEKGRGTEEGDCEGDSLEVMAGVHVYFANEQLTADFKGDGKG